MLEIELADRKVVSYLIKRFGIHAKHKLGQNFLVRPDVVRAIAEASEIGEGSRVLEIGPGIGTLTQALARTGAEVTAVEIDQSLGRILSHTLEPYKNVHIIYDDVLKLDLNKLMGNKEWHVAANLPYYITTPILLHLVQSDLPISTFVFMMQKEVAERLASGPGSKAYGILSVLLQAWYDVEYLFTVSEYVFDPPPKVKSAVIKMTRNSRTSLGCNEALFKTVVKTSFNQRRKTLRNSMKAILGKDYPDYSLPVFDKRPEQLSVEQFVELTIMTDKWLSANKTEV